MRFGMVASGVSTRSTRTWKRVPPSNSCGRLSIVPTMTASLPSCSRGSASVSARWASRAAQAAPIAVAASTAAQCRRSAHRASARPKAPAMMPGDGSCARVCSQQIPSRKPRTAQRMEDGDGVWLAVER